MKEKLERMLELLNTKQSDEHYSLCWECAKECESHRTIELDRYSGDRITEITFCSDWEEK